MCAHKESPRPQQMPCPREGRHPPHCSAHLRNKEAKKAQAEVFFPTPPPPATHSTSGAPVSPVRSTKFPYAHTMGGQGPVPGALHTKLCVYPFACLRIVGRLSLPPTISDHRNPAVEPTLFSLYQAVCCTSPWGWQCFNLHLKMLVKG